MSGLRPHLGAGASGGAPASIARARSVKLDRQLDRRPSGKKASGWLGMHADGLSYRLITGNVGMRTR